MSPYTLENCSPELELKPDDPYVSKKLITEEIFSNIIALIEKERYKMCVCEEKSFSERYYMDKGVELALKSIKIIEKEYGVTYEFKNVIRMPEDLNGNTAL